MTTDFDQDGRGGRSWILWLLLLAILGLVIWWLWQGAAQEDLEVRDETAVESARVEGTPMDASSTEPEATEVEARMTFVPVVDVVNDPEAWVGRSIDGEAVVTQVPTDRGFWLEQDGQRLFALLVDAPGEVPLDIEAGQTVRITGGVLRQPEDLESGVEGRPLDADSRRIAERQNVFLVVDEENVEIVEEA